MMHRNEILDMMQLDHAPLKRIEIPTAQAPDVQQSRNDEYDIFHTFFREVAPHWLKEHRKYFSTGGRGFGEDAFHAMWFALFRDFQPKFALEIGVFRGQVLSLLSLLSYNFGLSCEVHGISPFSPAGDSVSTYDGGIDYYADTIRNLRMFGARDAFLHKGFSTEEDMVGVIRSRKWDVIYIDGNHDYDVVRQDFENCRRAVRHGGLIVFDDASLFNGYSPASYSSAGHPGPSKVADEIDPGEFAEIAKVGHNRAFRRI